MILFYTFIIIGMVSTIIYVNNHIDSKIEKDNKERG